MLVHKLDAGILNSRNGVLVVSPESLSRPWVLEELASASLPGLVPCRRPSTPRAAVGSNGARLYIFGTGRYNHGC
jgi:TIR domain